MNGRTLVVKDVADLRQARGCQILFVASSGKRERAQILEALQGAHVLTVSDGEGFAEQGGIIQFVLQDGRVRFEINHKAAIGQRLVISARLLSVATAVIE